MKRWRIVILIAVLALVAAACANSDTSDSSTSSDATAETATTEASGGDDTATTVAPETDTTVAAETDTTVAAEDEVGYEHLALAEQGEYAGTSVTIQGQWVDAEEEAFTNSLAAFADRTGIDIVYEGVSDHETVLTVRVEGGDAPDIAQVAQPGLMRSFADSGDLVALDSFMNLEQLGTDYSEAWTDLGKAGDSTYGVFYKASTKSIVWYPVQAWADAGYEPPTTWDELMALSQQIIDDGNGNPWCISIEHGDASGWVATDWVEDILLRSAGTDVYDQWVDHTIAFDDAQVLEAAGIMNDIWFTPEWAWGGNTAINATFIGDIPTFMFTEGGPECWMHKQASWISDFFGTDPETEELLYTPGVDAKFFYLPSMSGDAPVLGSGDMFVMFNDRPEVQAVMEYLATADAAAGWAGSGGFISPNSSVPTDWYTDYASSEQSKILAAATALRFDASDIMPAEVGTGTFWAGMVDWVSANGEGTEGVFADIEAGWPNN
jgi:alpha-glucoside transport system substrate-binding protein